LTKISDSQVKFSVLYQENWADLLVKK